MRQPFPWATGTASTVCNEGSSCALPPPKQLVAVEDHRARDESAISGQAPHYGRWIHHPRQEPAPTAWSSVAANQVMSASMTATEIGDVADARPSFMEGSGVPNGNNTLSSTASSTTAPLSPSDLASSNVTGSAFPTDTATLSPSRPWSSYSPTTTRTSSGSAPTQSLHVQGAVFNLTLDSSREDEAVYSLPMTFGHADSASSERRTLALAKRDLDPQVINVLVDLGSSDMWLASDACSTADCKSAPALFDGSESLASDVALNISYQAGYAGGEISWEQVAVGSFSIGYQAFILADKVYNENLGGGNFTGLLGLALPANSLITEAIAGTTGSSPDGATFLDNLFGAGSMAPSERLFALSLERREDVRTVSRLAIGTVDPTFCPSPCSPSFLPIIAHSNLGRTGYLHWRVPLDDISVTTFSDPRNGAGASTVSIPLGASQVESRQSSPLAVLDSGGVPILVGHKPYADAIYSSFGIKASSDGLYRLPCTQQLALTLTFGGQAFPVHPLDMSWPDPTDSSQSMCVGAIQYSSSLGTAGDFILGSSFLKNVYSVFQYPDKSKNATWQPRVGLMSITNASVASRDFYAVRTLHQSLQDVSANQASSGIGMGPPSPSAGAAQNAAQHKVVSTAIIAACSVVGFFVLAAAAFCAWWFWLRRKLGAAGVVEYRMANPGHRSDNSTSTLRSRKHEETKRQMSMIDGYSDYEVDSWRSTTEGNDSIRLGKLPETTECDDHSRLRTSRYAASSHTRDSSVHRSLLRSDPGSAAPPVTDFNPDSNRRSSAATSRFSDRRGSTGTGVLFGSPATGRLIELPSSPPTSPTSHSFALPSSGSAGGLSLSMSGPFPTPTRPPTAHHSSGYFPPTM